ncbi:MAG: lipopolysaccharide heptosyltransferase II [Fusobacteria bacterium]|nr:lipopolysaccharide heptosyltransferase II [Fusobacteriota bacterium]
MKILIIHTAFIGDIILSTPFIKKIKSTYKDAKIDYLTTPLGAEILKNNPLLDKIIVYDKKNKDRGIIGFFRVVNKLRKEKYNTTYILHRYLRSTLIGFFSNIKNRVGYNLATGKILLNKKVIYNKDAHEVDRILAFVDNALFTEKKIELYPGITEVDSIDEIFNKNQILKSNKIVVIAPGSKWKTKMWPIERYNELIKSITEHQKETKIIVIGGKDEEKLDIVKHKNIINLVGKTSLLETAEIIKRSDVIVTNDSSPIHIASAFDTYIIAIFGATVKELGFYPWSKNSIVVENKNINCRPCGLHGGNRCKYGHFRCMMDISVEKVYKIVENRVKI